MRTIKNYLFLFVFVLGLGMPIASAATTASDVLSTSTCPDDYYGFILDVRSPETKRAYFKDIFTLSYCQLNDIFEIYDQLNDLQDNFRDAAFACEDTTSYKADYNKLLMEVYFIRNVQKSVSGLLNELDEEIIQSKKEAMLDNIRAEMHRVFVTEEKRVADDEILDGYIDEWERKYDDRLADYRNCSEGAWAELNDVWSDFVETLSDLSIDVDKPEKRSFSDVITPDLEAEGSVDTGSFGRSVLHAWDYFKKNNDVEAIDDETLKSVSDIVAEGTTTFEDAFKKLIENETLVSIDEASRDRASKYQRLYGENGALAATDMANIVKQLNFVIEEANTTHFPNISVSVSKIYDKQCN